MIIILLLLLFQVVDATNLVVLYVDDLTSLTNSIRNHPFLERIKSTSIKFNYAISSTPLCLPSRSATLFGVPSYKSKIYVNNQSYINSYPSHVSLPELLQRDNYTIGIYGKVFHNSEEKKLKKVFKNMFSNFSIYGINHTFYDFYRINTSLTRRLKTSQKLTIGNLSSASIDDVIFNHSLKFIESLNSTSKFAFFFGLREPHMPFFYHYRQNQYINKTLNKYYNEIRNYTLDGPPLDYNQELFYLINKVNKKYDFISSYYRAASSSLDVMEKMYKLLESKNLLNDTMIVFLSDHGFELLSNSHFAKGNQNMLAVKTQLYISLPSRIPSKCNKWASQTDLYYTILKFLNVNKLPPQNITKNNLLNCNPDPIISTSLRKYGIEYSLFWSNYQYRRFIGDNSTILEQMFYKNDIFKQHPLNITQRFRKILNNTLNL